MLGPEIEQVLGRRRYILFSTICAESSMVGFLLFNWGTGNIVLGYSGVIFGILVAQAVFFPSNTIVIFAFFPLRMKYAVLLLGVVELYFMLAPDGGGIAHAAHLFGALAALIYLKAPTWCRRLRLPNEAPPKRPAIRRAVQRKAWKDVPREL
jgi:membrane associated rhomboid family serine protease